MVNKKIKIKKNIFYLNFGFTLLIVYSTIAYSNYFLRTEALAQKDNFSMYESSFFGIKMLYPQDWHRTDNGNSPGANTTVVDFIGPTNNTDTTGDVGTTSPSVNLFVFKSSANISLSDLINNTLSQIESFNMIPTKAIHLKDNTTAYQTAYQISTRYNTFEKMQTFTMKNGLIYVITYTATPDKYLLYLPTVKRMIDSLTISPPIMNTSIFKYKLDSTNQIFSLYKYFL
jgi:PsbP-like protein